MPGSTFSRPPSTHTSRPCRARSTGLHDVRRIHAEHEPAEPPLERQRPHPLRQLALLDVERRVRELLDVPHVIEVRVRDEDAGHLRRRHPALGQHRLRRLPVAHAVARRQHLAVRLVVVADVDHRRLALALEHDVAIGHLAVALVVRAVDEQAGGLFEHMRIFHDPDRVAGHSEGPHRSGESGGSGRSGGRAGRVRRAARGGQMGSSNRARTRRLRSRAARSRRAGGVRIRRAAASGSDRDRRAAGRGDRARP